MDQELISIINDFIAENMDATMLKESTEIKEKSGELLKTTLKSLSEYQPSNEDNLLIKCAFKKECKKYNKNLKDSLDKNPENIRNATKDAWSKLQKMSTGFSTDKAMKNIQNPEQRKKLQEECYEDILTQNIESDKNNSKIPSSKTSRQASISK